MEEKTLKINNLEINCKSLIEFSSLINVLLELAKKQKETEKKLGEHDLKINNLLKLITAQQKEQKEQKDFGIGWQDKENELSNILNDEHIFSMNYNNSNFSNYINNENLNDAQKQYDNLNDSNDLEEKEKIPEEDNKIVENEENKDNKENKEKDENEEKEKEKKEENVEKKEKEKKEERKDIPFPKIDIKENIEDKKDDKQNIVDNQTNENQNIRRSEESPQKISPIKNNYNIPTTEKEPVPIQTHKNSDKSNKNTEIISKMFQRIILLEKKVAELASKSNDNMILRTINLNKQNINNHSDNIKKLKESTEKLSKEINDIKDKMKDFNLYDMFNDGNTGDGAVDITKALLKALETKTNKKFDLFEEKYKLLSAESFKNKDDIKNQGILINGHKPLIEKNSEKISNIIQELKDKEISDKELKEKENEELNKKFEEIIKNIETLGENYDNKFLELESKISERQKQPVLVTDIKPEKKPKDKKRNSDNFNLLKEYNERILDLEKNMRQILKKLNIEEINSNLAVLQKEISKKGNQGAIDEIIDRLYNVDETIKQISYRVDSSQAIEKKVIEENSNLSKKFESFANQVNRLSFQVLKNPKEDKPTVDYTKFIEIGTFEENKKDINKKFDKIRISFEDIIRHIDDILDKLSHTPTDKDFSQYQDVVKSMIDELRINSNKKYADKYDTLKNFKFLETQIKTVNENYNKKLEGQDNWLLAKKPLNNYLCASCEGIIKGELDKRCDYIPWNKYPNREEKYTRMGHGFSHMLQMVNDDIRKNVDTKEKEKEKNKIEDKEKEYNSDEDKKKTSGDRNNSLIKLPKVKVKPRNYNNINLLEDTTWERSPYDISDKNLTLQENSPQIMKISRIKKNISIKNTSPQEASLNDESSNKGKNYLNIKTFPSENTTFDKKQNENE